jgi:hypothetical protein
MAHKIASLFSFIFVIQLLLLIGDMSAIQVIQTNMLSFATTVSHEVALRGRLDEAIVARASTNGYTLECVATCFPQFGDTLTYSLTITYSPLIISKDPLPLVLTRYVVIGVYY